MKTLIQIHNKAITFANKLSKSKTMFENFGQKEVRELKNYIGDVYEYPIEQRQEIFAQITALDNFAMNFSPYN